MAIAQKTHEAVPAAAVKIREHGKDRMVYFEDDPEIIAARLHEAVDRKHDEIQRAFNAHITAGFTSAALGRDYIYALADAPMLTAAALMATILGNGALMATILGNGVAIPCRANANTGTRMVQHDTAQLQTAAGDYAQWHTAALQNRQDKFDAIAAATTVAEVEALNW